MSAETSSSRKPVTWVNSAFIVEAIILLVFLVGSIAVFMQVYSAAAQSGTRGADLAAATNLAQSAAEKFAADPANAAGTVQDDSYTVDTQVSDEDTAAGTLYHAHIVVSSPDEEVFALDMARYVSGGEA